MELNIAELLKAENPEQEIKAAIDAHVDGLKRKNTELLGEQKKLKSDLAELGTKVDELSAAEAAKAEEAANKAGDVEAIRKQLTDRYTKDLAKLTGERDAIKAQVEALVIDGGLSAELSRIGVAAPYADAVKALLKTRTGFAVETVDGKPQATANGEPLSAYIDAWAGSDEARHYVSAADNSGGGAAGSRPGSGGSGAGDKNPWDPKHRNLSKQMEIARDNPARARELAGAHGITLSV